MKESTELSKQQLKSKETKEKIFQAAKRILQKNGYENLSIKNICEEAGVSNGSFGCLTLLYNIISQESFIQANQGLFFCQIFVNNACAFVRFLI